MVLEDRTDAKARKSYVIDRVHEDTRVLSLIDGDGVLTRMKIGDISADWRLFSRETLSVAAGEKLLAVAGDREHSLKAKDRLEVTGISEKGIEVKRGEETLTLPKDQPLYLSHAYVTAPGGRDNDTGVVLAALNSRDISSQTMNSLAQSGHRAEVFTAEVQDRAEARLQRMKTNASPVQLVRSLSGLMTSARRLTRCMTASGRTPGWPSGVPSMTSALWCSANLSWRRRRRNIIPTLKLSGMKLAR